MNPKIKKNYRKGRTKSSDRIDIADTRILTRILIILGDVRYCNITYFKENGLNLYKVSDGLIWLINHNIVSEINNHSKFYCLKEFENQVKNIIKLEEQIRNKKMRKRNGNKICK
jgi:hypothetical protein